MEIEHIFLKMLQFENSAQQQLKQTVELLWRE